MSGIRFLALAAALIGCTDGPTATRIRRPAFPHLTVIPGGQTCIVDRPGTGCVGANWTTGYYQTPNVFFPFQHTAGTAPQPEVVIGLSGIRSYCVYANDIDATTRVHARLKGSIQERSSYDLAGDGNSTIFSNATFCDTAPYAAQFDRIRMPSPSGDYVNWNVIFKVNDSDPTWCRIESRVFSCNGAVGEVVNFAQSTYLTPFHGAVSGPSRDPVEIQFAEDLYKVQLTAVDADAPGTHMIAYDASGNMLQQVNFTNDNFPTRYTQSQQSITSSVGIRRIRLVSAANDDVAFKGLSVWRGGYLLGIDGSSRMPPGSTCYYYASANGGVAPYTYTWSWTTSGGGSAGGYSPSNGTFVLAAQSQSGTIHLTAMSTDATGNTSSTTKDVSISPFSNGCES